MAERSDASILVVDDNENNRYTLIRRLRGEGYTKLAEAEDGEEALQSIATHEFDLVLLDIMLPKLSGYQVLDAMRSEGRLSDLPVIVVSAIDDLDSVVRCIELGAEDYLTKPINASLLRARVNAVLEKKRLRDEVAQQLAFIRDIFGRYVPPSVAGELVAGRGTLRPTQTTATILFTDIEQFTAIAEGMPPEQVVQMLNEYFPAVIEPVRRHMGVVNQFQGDAMLVTFNVPVGDPRHADNAVRAALGILEVTRSQRFAGVELKTRIGINTGAVIAGNVGSGDRMSYTVHGDAVNLAARIEQLNKAHGTQLLVSGSTVAHLNGSYDLRAMGSFDVRGKREMVDVFGLG